MTIYFDPRAAAVYSIWLKNPAGQPVAVIDRFIFLEYIRVVNDVGSLKLILEDYLPPSYWVEDSILEVWRKIPGSRPYVDGETVWRVRKIRKIQDQGGVSLEIIALDTQEILSRPRVAYYSGTAFTRKTGLAGSVIREFVYQNAGPGATSSDRWSSGGYDSSVFQIEADKGLGTTVDAKNVIGQSLLTVAQKLSAQSAEDGSPLFFDVVRIDDNLLEFRTYAGQRGIDRGPGSAQEIELSAKRGTLEDAIKTTDWFNAYNTVFAAGGGQGINRAIGVASNPVAAGAGPFARIETLIDAQSITNPTTLVTLATGALPAGAGRLTIDGKLVDTPGLRYGVHYNFGDRVSCGFGDEVFAARIDGVQVTVREGREEIRTALKIEV